MNTARLNPTRASLTIVGLMIRVQLSATFRGRLKLLPVSWTGSAPLMPFVWKLAKEYRPDRLFVSDSRASILTSNWSPVSSSLVLDV
jgi:hypothetical protein